MKFSICFFFNNLVMGKIEGEFDNDKKKKIS
jgi:hypothetical protein